jgi:predicted translation initiation factor SUI1
MAKLASGPGWAFSSADDPFPAIKKANPNTPKPVVRLEKRTGKYVTVISGLHTYGSERLSRMAKEWKTLCWAGGTVKSGVIEIQGDHCDRVIEALKKQGWVVKRAGG